MTSSQTRASCAGWAGPHKTPRIILFDFFFSIFIYFCFSLWGYRCCHVEAKWFWRGPIQRGFHYLCSDLGCNLLDSLCALRTCMIQSIFFIPQLNKKKKTIIFGSCQLCFYLVMVRFNFKFYDLFRLSPLFFFCTNSR